MRPIDYAKALGLAVAVLALNLLITTAAIVVYSYLVEPGQPQSFYSAMAPKIGAWTGPVGGMLLMFATGYLFGRRRPERNAFAFVGAVFVVYLLIDAALGLALAPAAQVFRLTFILSLTGAALAGFAGAALARRR
jgi:hypothetical protein